MANDSTPPVILVGRAESGLSRWLWLLKWLLLVPHVVVLVVLWLAVAVVTVIAWFAILFQARYPRSLFAFNLGVMRWTWRVGFYGYVALGTDRYPPFSLGPCPDYPAFLEVRYPDRLSRRLVLVKAWLLAIPHYLILGLFFGAGGAGTGDRHAEWPGSTGLVGLLVLFLGLALLFARRYPAGIFDLVMGMNRWGARVAAYAMLMTDTYPPFRLDQGSQEQSQHESGHGHEE